MGVTGPKGDWHTKEAKDVLKALSSSKNGISDSEAGKRLNRYGPNKLEKEKPVSRLTIFLSQFKSFLVIILIAATIFSAAIGEVIDAVAILVIVILNGIFGYVQERGCE